MYTVEDCYQRLVEKAKKEGWEIPTRTATVTFYRT
ncbi:DNA-binding domain-containing protein [Pasteurella multocida]